MTAPIPFSESLRLDAELARLARGTSALRLAIGEALDALWSSGGHHELGFSSFEAYARERCEQSGRWAIDTRALTRKLHLLPRTRNALKTGLVGWSTAELLARHVTSDSERQWLEKAHGATVRQLRRLLAETAGLDDADAEAAVRSDAEAEPTQKLAFTVTREDGWLFECARKAAEAVAGPITSDRLLQTLLAEGYSTLLELVPEAGRAELYGIERLECETAAESEAHAAWCSQRDCWRREAEELCEKRGFPTLDFVPEDGDATGSVASSMGPEALDREIRRLCSELSKHDLALGIVAESARRAEVWRRLGFATEAQYARERVGVSLSSLKAKRILAARASRVPELAGALSSGRVGYEAAYLLSRVVTPRTAEPWIRRAEQRTVKHLREDVEAAELLMRVAREREPLPLDEDCLDELFELERWIMSGDWLGRTGDPWVADWLGRDRDSWAADGAKSKAQGAGQMSGAQAKLARSFGRVALRFGVTETTYRFWRALERAFARLCTRVGRAPMCFLRFLCENFCGIWLPVLRQGCRTESGELPEYFGVYWRDAFRCTSPVCRRRDVTPHHLVFRSHGGGDEDENVASLCSWCHLRGVHEGRIAAEPPASRIRWRIGRSGTLRVEGRTRLQSLGIQ
jgi:hypothetical protein